MKSPFRQPSFASVRVVRVAILCAIVATVTFTSSPVLNAASSHSESSMAKHARKVHAKLEKYRPGSYLHIVLRDRTNQYGALGTLTDDNFSFKDSDTNAVNNISYADVGKINSDREPIGEGSEHHIRPRTLVVAGVLAAGAAVAAFEVR